MKATGILLIGHLARKSQATKEGAESALTIVQSAIRPSFQKRERSSYLYYRGSMLLYIQILGQKHPSKSHEW